MKASFAMTSDFGLGEFGRDNVFAAIPCGNACPHRVHIPASLRKGQLQAAIGCGLKINPGLENPASCQFTVLVNKDCFGPGGPDIHASIEFDGLLLYVHVRSSLSSAARDGGGSYFLPAYSSSCSMKASIWVFDCSSE
jgi:hypothetical protein